MEGYKVALINEIYKLSKKKKIFASLIFSIFAVIVGQLAVNIINNNLGLNVAKGAEFPIAILSFISYTLLPLFTAFVAIDMFSSEFSSNTMKITLTRPASRFGVYMAKITNIGLFIIMNLFFVMASSIIAGLIFNFSAFNVEAILSSMLAYIVTFLPIFVLAIFVVFLSIIFRNGLIAFFLSVIISIGFFVVGIIFNRYSSFMVTSMFDWYKLWIAPSPNVFKILRQILIMFGFGTMVFAAGYYMFDRKEI